MNDTWTNYRDTININGVNFLGNTQQKYTKHGNKFNFRLKFEKVNKKIYFDHILDVDNVISLVNLPFKLYIKDYLGKYNLVEEYNKLMKAYGFQ